MRSMTERPSHPQLTLVYHFHITIWFIWSTIMSRYEPLAQFLTSKKSDSWEASFEEIERQLGAPLPKSAYKYPAWWANQSGPGHSQTRGWRSVGWRTCDLDLERRRVRFERESTETAARSTVRESSSGYGLLERERGEAQSAGRFGDGRTTEDLVERARELTGITDRDALIHEALRLLVAREAGLRLARLGGTMPDLKVPPRQRPAS